MHLPSRAPPIRARTRPPLPPPRGGRTQACPATARRRPRPRRPRRALSRAGPTPICPTRDALSPTQGWWGRQGGGRRGLGAIYCQRGPRERESGTQGGQVPHWCEGGADAGREGVNSAQAVFQHRGGLTHDRGTVGVPSCPSSRLAIIHPFNLPSHFPTHSGRYSSTFPCLVLLGLAFVSTSLMASGPACLALPVSAATLRLHTHGAKCPVLNPIELGFKSTVWPSHSASMCCALNFSPLKLRRQSSELMNPVLCPLPTC